MKIETIRKAEQYRYTMSEVEGTAVGLMMTDELLEITRGSTVDTRFCFGTSARKILLLALMHYREQLLDENDVNEAKAWAADPGPGPGD